MDAGSGSGNGTRASSHPLRLWRADLVCPVAGEPIRGGAILTRGGRVEAVGPADSISSADGLEFDRDFGAAVLVPGLVNAHTHIELSGIDLAPAPMAEWIVRLVREVRGWPAHLFLSSSRIGAAASFGSGVTCVGDISASGHSVRILSDLGMRGVVFHEVLGLQPSEAEAIVERKIHAMEEAEGKNGGPAGSLRSGLSPHAPYTASAPLYRAALSAARSRGWPTATHLAESPEEVRFLKDGGGPLAGMHEELGSPLEGFAPPGAPPVRYLSDAGALDGIDLAVHCNQTGPEEWELFKIADVAVCLCPRSAEFFGHPFADAIGMRRAGVRLCIGTDSRASSPSLSVLEEAAALLDADPGLTPEALLEICTVSGAEVLGLAGNGVGRILSGGVADFAAVDPPPGEERAELAGIFRPGAQVRTTVLNGTIRFDREA
ncbi:MAG: amidohydrolase family protein [bacterium]